MESLVVYPVLGGIESKLKFAFLAGSRTLLKIRRRARNKHDR